MNVGYIGMFGILKAESRILQSGKVNIAEQKCARVK